MALLLHIDTATSYGAVAISEDAALLALAENPDQKEHASFLHPAIEKMVQQAGTALHRLDAVAVTIGPGSYTGLRVGLAAAKGLCYALQKPLIAVSTLQAMALAAQKAVQGLSFDKPVLFAPMIDARRMEVYTALYDAANRLFRSPQALELDAGIFREEAAAYTVVCSGDGSEKLVRAGVEEDRFLIKKIHHSMKENVQLASTHWYNKTFEDLAYCEPFYLKPVHVTGNVKK